MLVNLPAKLSTYKCWIFDCDGVLLNSNEVKTEAFRTSVIGYGSEKADELVNYHILNGGISRFKKFDYFFEAILGRAPKKGEMDELLKSFAKVTIEGLLNCDEAEGLRELLDAIPSDVPKLVVSGGAQSELREIFKQRGLAPYFTAIYGSPDTKEAILIRERKNNVLSDPAIYIGDSRYDYEAATACGLDFIFVYGWTEFKDWQEYFSNKDVLLYEGISKIK